MGFESFLPQTMENGHGKGNVLVVDDEQGWRDLLAMELVPSGFRATTASSGPEALEILKRESFDLIISDIQMAGGMDGIDFIEHQRRNKPDQKVIFITGYALEEKLNTALQNPLSICLRKPFEMDQLFETISKFLP